MTKMFDTNDPNVCYNEVCYKGTALYLYLFYVFQDLNEVPLEGEITVPGLNTDDDEFSTLDEPVKDTIVINLEFRTANKTLMTISLYN